MFSVCLFTGPPPTWGGVPGGTPPKLGGAPGGTPPKLGGAPGGTPPPTGGGAPPGVHPPINLDKNGGQNLGQNFGQTFWKLLEVGARAGPQEDCLVLLIGLVTLISKRVNRELKNTRDKKLLGSSRLKFAAMIPESSHCRKHA